MRYFNYLENFHELREGFIICEKIYEDIKDIDLSYFDALDREYIIELYKKAIELKRKLGSSSYYWDQAINSDLLRPENVEYCFKHQHYPEHASKKGDQLNKIFRNFFIIEDKMQIYIAKMWKKLSTPFNEIKNGEPFVIFGHSGYGYITLPGTRGHNKHSNDTNISCSIFTDKCMNCFNSNLVMTFDITPDSYISSSPFDAATRKVDLTKSIKTLKETSNGIISAGYSYISDTSKAVTKCSNPIQVLHTINTQDDSPLTGKGHINETIIDKDKAHPTGLVLFSSGCDLLLGEYMNALRMKYDYNLDLKVINRGLYRKKAGLSSYLDTDIEELEHSMKFYQRLFMSNEYSYDDVVSIIDSYIDNVMDKLELESEVYNRLLLYFDNLKKMKKENQLS
jgi:hypothetical protein